VKVLIFLFSFHALAEYRVYQYFVRPRVFQNQDQYEYIISSSLDPITYSSYHGGPDVIEIELARTWICPGHTGNFRPYCKSPYANLRVPALEEKK
jgi:hypothetical protein